MIICKIKLINLIQLSHLSLISRMWRAWWWTLNIHVFNNFSNLNSSLKVIFHCVLFFLILTGLQYSKSLFKNFSLLKHMFMTFKPSNIWKSQISPLFKFIFELFSTMIELNWVSTIDLDYQVYFHFLPTKIIGVSFLKCYLKNLIHVILQKDI